ncbi:bifunctional metallophosphatase/5'-nucleotidase [Bifidobacterium simiarum]|uniref:bifunctional metallophosphatase/5'-nucleotidase n=1 Tax=Bifidobacterium simiarum TaxID=2045441 RepID=UPI001C30353A|nr:5'-nucleotidase C-terminal domain-containing protein [Bifidobacterium simiarum]
MAVLAALSLLSGLAARRAAAQETEPSKITIADITDFHGHIEQGPWIADQLGRVREYNPGNTVAVSAGDLVGGSPYESALHKDEPALAMAKAWGLTISAMGNHELDRGVKDFNDRIASKSHGIEWLAANVRKTGPDGISHLRDYTIRMVAGKRVAFVGAVTDRLGSVLSRSVMRDVRLDESAVTAVNRVADRLSDGDESNGEADVVVALIHDDADLVAKDPVGLDANVDLVYAGHTHAVKTDRRTASGAPIIEAGCFGRYVAVQDLMVSGSGRRAQVSVSNSFGGPLVGDWPSSTDPAKVVSAVQTTISPTDAVESILRRADASARRAGDVVVSSVSQRYDRTGRDDRDPKTGRIALYTLIADAALDGARRTTEGAHARVGFVNPGSLRTQALDLDGDGFVTVREASDMMALQFDNAVVTLDGATLRRAIAQQWHRDDEGHWRSGQLGVSSNVTWTMGLDGDEPKVLDLKVDGRPVADGERITVAGNSFLLTGGDGYRAFLRGAGYADTGVPYARTLIDFLRSHD